jgi:hypothetical protein
MVVKKTIFIIFVILLLVLAWIYRPGKPLQTQDIRENLNFDRYRKHYTFFKINAISFTIPIAGWSLDSLLRRSVLYLPADVVRDGLPWFGSLRDDWRSDRENRFHQGIDIYGDSLVITAAADGIVERTDRDGFSGGIVKIDHGHHIKTVYIHLSEILITQGKHIPAGSHIGQILSPEGNARQSQLHFELQVDGVKRDPLYYIKNTYPYAPEICLLLNEFEQTKSRHIRNRYQILNQLK